MATGKFFQGITHRRNKAGGNAGKTNFPGIVRVGLPVHQENILFALTAELDKTHLAIAHTQVAHNVILFVDTVGGGAASAVGKLVVNGTWVKVRSNAGVGYGRLGYAQHRGTYNVFGQAKDNLGRTWYKINYGSGYGYIIADYVAYTHNPTTTTTTTTTTTAAATTTTTTTTTASTSETTTTTATTTGSTTAATAETTTTAAATTTTTTTTTTKPTTTTTATTVHPRVIERMLTVSVGSASVHSDAGSENTVLGTVKKDEKYLATDWKNDSRDITWYAFEKDGRTVWIDRRSVTISDSYKTIANRDFSSGNAPVIYLSPSRQPANLFAVGSTSEQEQMERVANELAAILRGEYVCTVYVAPTSMPIEMYGRPYDAFTKGADVHLAIHSNANPSGTSYGSSCYYFPACSQSYKLSKNIVAELDKIAPKTPTLSSRTINGMLDFNGIGYGDVRNPSHYGMIAVLAEVEYHDNADSAQWIINNTDKIARSLATALEKTLTMRKK